MIRIADVKKEVEEVEKIEGIRVKVQEPPPGASFRDLTTTLEHIKVFRSLCMVFSPLVALVI